MDATNHVTFSVFLQVMIPTIILVLSAAMFFLQTLRAINRDNAADHKGILTALQRLVDHDQIVYQWYDSYRTSPWAQGDGVGAWLKEDKEFKERIMKEIHELTTRIHDLEKDIKHCE